MILDIKSTTHRYESEKVNHGLHTILSRQLLWNTQERLRKSSEIKVENVFNDLDKLSN